MSLHKERPFKKIFRVSTIIIVVLLALIGLYRVYMNWQYNSIKSFVEAKEESRQYDPDLLYLLPNGRPIFMVNPSYSSTLFFIEGFRGQVGAAIYRDWFEKLHKKYRVNIVSPIIGLHGWPFRQRTRDWYHQEDMRQALQIYDAYTANLPKNHTIVIASQSFGALPNVTIAAFGKRKPDAHVLISPLNTGLEYRSAGRVVAWFSSQLHWLRHIIPFMRRGNNPKRAEMWDIVNDDNNRRVWQTTAKDIINWEENLDQGTLVREAAQYMEDSLVPKVKGRRFYIFHGDSDLYFSSKGFNGLAERLRKAGNSVEVMAVKDAGHMLLFDNGNEGVKKRIRALLRAR